MSNIDLLGETDVSTEHFIYDRIKKEEDMNDVESLFYNSGMGEVYSAVEENKNDDEIAEIIKRCINRLTEHQKQMKEELEKRQDLEYSNEEDAYIDCDFDNFLFDKN